MSSPSSVEPTDQTGPSGESKPADSPIAIYRHSSAHLLAAAVTELFPEAQCGIGPPTEDGFFYDFLVSKPFTPEDLAAIEKTMAHIVKQNRPIEKKLLPKTEALELFAKKGQTLKCELVAEKSGDPVQCASAQHSALRRQAAALVVGEPQLSAAQLLAEHAVLFLQVVDHRDLAPVDPTGERQQQELQRRGAHAEPPYRAGSRGQTGPRPAARDAGTPEDH
jgi:hypothetical protein